MYRRAVCLAKPFPKLLLFVFVQFVVPQVAEVAVRVRTAAHRVVVFGPCWAGVRGTHRGAVVGLMRGVEHVHHGHTQVHSQRVDHEEAVAGEQRQAVTRRAASRRCRKTKVCPFFL